MKRRLLLWSLVALFAFLCLPFLNPKVAQLLYSLPWRWTGFLGRTIPQVTVNWAGIGMGVAVSGGILAGLHWVCGWLRAMPIGSSHDPPPSRQWTWRWTVALYLTLWLLFGIAMGTAGVARHLEWLAESKEPLYVARANHVADLRLAAAELQMALLEGNGRMAQSQAAFLASQQTGLPRGSIGWERFHSLFFPGQDEKIAVAVILPRDPKAFAKAGFAVIDQGGQPEFLSMTNFPVVLGRLQNRKRN